MSVVQQVLSELDWNTGFTIPVANEENKRLEKEILENQRAADETKANVGNLEERLHAMEDHLGNVRQELTSCQQLVNARKNQIDAEEHVNKIAEREIGRLQQEMRKLKGQIEELHERKNSKENQIFDLNKKVEDLKSQLKWDEEALEAWLEESAKKDEDMLALSKYARQDESKVKELSLALTKMTQERTEKHRSLDHEVMETQMAQIELDRIAEDFRRAHEERKELLHQWEQTVAQMQRRDHDMERLQQQLQAVKMELNQRQQAVRDRQQLLENQLRNNKDYENRINEAEGASGKLYAEKAEALKAVDVYDSELKAFQRTVDRTCQELEKERRIYRSMKDNDLPDAKNRLLYFQQENERKKDQLMVAKAAENDAELLANQMDELVIEAEKTEARMDVELKRLRELEFRKAQETFEVKERGKHLDAEITGSEAVLRNMSARISKLDGESLKQQEIIYNQDFNLHQLEHRLGRMSGETGSEEKLELDKKIRELNNVLEQRNQAHQLLVNQLNMLNDDVKKVERDMDNRSRDQADLETKLNEIDLHTETSNKLMKRLQHEKQETTVESNILQLQVKRLQKQLMSKATSVMSEEKKRLELETAMRERRDEIQLHKEMLSNQLRSSETERSQINAELTERKHKIDKLEKRYEIIMVTMAPPEGEEEHSQAYYVIKAAQDREEYQRKGDDLDAKIRKAEKELRAMNNTLAVLNGRNEQYRKSFQKVTESSEEAQTKVELDEQLQTVMEKWRNTRRSLQQAQGDLQQMKSTAASMMLDETQYEENHKMAVQRVQALERELEEQAKKIERASAQLTKLSKALRIKEGTLGDGASSKAEKDIELRERRDFNRRTMKQMNEFLSTNPDYSGVVGMYFAEAHLPAPGGPASQQSTARSSRAGSVSSSISSSSSQSSVRMAAVTIGGGALGGDQQKRVGTASRGSARSPKQPPR